MQRHRLNSLRRSMVVSLPSLPTEDKDSEGLGLGSLESLEVSEFSALEEALESEIGMGSDLDTDVEMAEIRDGGGVDLE